jgi:sortase A
MSSDRYFSADSLRRNAAIVLIVFGVGLAGVAIGLKVRNHKPELEPSVQSSTSHTGLSSTKPTTQAVADYSVPATDPKYLSISSIGIDKARVMKLGLTRDNQIAVPSNIYNTGWYEGSVTPGQNGAMFIYGHVSSWTANGIFYNLKKLAPGDQIIVTSGNNKTFTYQVVSSKVYPYDKVDMGHVLAPIKPGAPGLSLMTCTGQIIKGTGEFNQRLVVFASLVTM